MKNHTIQYIIFIALVSITLLIYVFIRAYTLSFTHDESLSFTIIQGDNTWKDTANNHLLNTLLMTLSKKMIGTSEIALRLPNVFFFIVYLIGCFLLFNKNKWISILGFSTALFNPFLIEFFSVARGYGISLSCMVISIYFMIRNNKQYSTSSIFLIDFVLTTFFASLAIYANLAIINVYISILIIFGIKYWLFRKSQNISLSFAIKFWSAYLISIIPILLGIVRLLKLKDANELYFGTAHFIKGFDSLTYSSIYLQEYTSFIIFSSKTVIAIFLLTSILYIIRKKEYNSALFNITLLIICLTIGLFSENILFDAKFPTTRTALFYIPISSIFVYHLFTSLIEKYQIKKQYFIPFILLIIIPIFINFIGKINLSHTTTWKYDAHTKDVMTRVKNNTKNKQVKITSHWLFAPTINYYINHWKLNLNTVNKDGVKLDSDLVYKFDDQKDTLNDFEVISFYDDINSHLLQKTTPNYTK